MYTEHHVRLHITEPTHRITLAIKTFLLSGCKNQNDATFQPANSRFSPEKLARKNKAVEVTNGESANTVPQRLQRKMQRR